jgi:hypothetical protein
MSINFVRPGWFYFYEDGHLKRLYGRRYESNEKTVTVLYKEYELIKFKQQDIVREEEDIYASDYNLMWSNYLEIVK